MWHNRLFCGRKVFSLALEKKKNNKSFYQDYRWNNIFGSIKNTFCKKYLLLIPQNPLPQKLTRLNGKELTKKDREASLGLNGESESAFRTCYLVIELLLLHLLSHKGKEMDLSSSSLQWQGCCNSLAHC